MRAMTILALLTIGCEVDSDATATRNDNASEPPTSEQEMEGSGKVYMTSGQMVLRTEGVEIYPVALTEEELETYDTYVAYHSGGVGSGGVGGGSTGSEGPLGISSSVLWTYSSVGETGFATQSLINPYNVPISVTFTLSGHEYFGLVQPGVLDDAGELVIQDSVTFDIPANGTMPLMLAYTPMMVDVTGEPAYTSYDGKPTYVEEHLTWISISIARDGGVAQDLGLLLGEGYVTCSPDLNTGEDCDAGNDSGQDTGGEDTGSSDTGDTGTGDDTGDSGDTGSGGDVGGGTGDDSGDTGAAG